MAVNFHVDIISKAFADERGGETAVIRDLCLSLTSGEFITLLGPSGAGKSTLLNIVAGLDTDYEGNVQLQRTDGSDARISLMFQEPRLMPWLTICENVMLVCVGSRAERRNTALHWLQQVGLNGAAQQYPAQLSGGMLKRAALARAFACEPDILLMDEPFSSLDIPAADALRALLMALCQSRQTTVVYVTHDITEALTLSDRVLLMRSKPMQVEKDISLALPRPRNPHTTELSALAERFKQSLADPV